MMNHQNTYSRTTTQYLKVIFHTHFRDYDWRTGRWDREDPAGYVDGLNLYNAYFDVNGVDATGLDVYRHAYFKGRWLTLIERESSQGAMRTSNGLFELSKYEIYDSTIPSRRSRNAMIGTIFSQPSPYVSVNPKAGKVYAQPRKEGFGFNNNLGHFVLENGSKMTGEDAEAFFNLAITKSGSREWYHTEVFKQSAGMSLRTELQRLIWHREVKGNKYVLAAEALGGLGDFIAMAEAGAWVVTAWTGGAGAPVALFFNRAGKLVAAVEVGLHVYNKNKSIIKGGVKDGAGVGLIVDLSEDFIRAIGYGKVKWVTKSFDFMDNTAVGQYLQSIKASSSPSRDAWFEEKLAPLIK